MRLVRFSSVFTKVSPTTVTMTAMLKKGRRKMKGESGQFSKSGFVDVCLPAAMPSLYV